MFHITSHVSIVCLIGFVLQACAAAPEDHAEISSGSLPASSASTTNTPSSGIDGLLGTLALVGAVAMVLDNDSEDKPEAASTTSELTTAARPSETTSPTTGIGTPSLGYMDRIPHTPTIRSITPGDSRVKLEWSDVPGAKKYTLCFTKDSPDPDPKTCHSGNTYNYTEVSGLAIQLHNNTWYYFKVRASTGYRSSDFSAEVSAYVSGS